MTYVRHFIAVIYGTYLWYIGYTISDRNLWILLLIFCIYGAVCHVEGLEKAKEEERWKET